MYRLFKENTSYIKRARYIALLWTLLIFILCFIPGHDLPNVHIPLIDKWAHIILFGVFTFLWHCTVPTKSWRFKMLLLLICLFMGWLVEYVQGHFIPNRSQDNMDTLADIIGGFIGIIIYTLLYLRFNNSKKAQHRAD